MYSNDPDAIRESLCFFMDENQGHEIAYVQYPQRYNNATKNDIYGNVARVTHQVSCRNDALTTLFNNIFVYKTTEFSYVD